MFNKRNIEFGGKSSTSYYYNNYQTKFFKMTLCKQLKKAV